MITKNVSNQNVNTLVLNLYEFELCSLKILNFQNNQKTLFRCFELDNFVNWSLKVSSDNILKGFYLRLQNLYFFWIHIDKTCRTVFLILRKSDIKLILNTFLQLIKNFLTFMNFFVFKSRMCIKKGDLVLIEEVVLYWNETQLPC